MPARSWWCRALNCERLTVNIPPVRDGNHLISHLFHSQERVKLCQWLKKLSELRSDKLEDVKMKHEYMQYLRVSLQGDYKLLTKPFNDAPPDDLVPFAEMIANKTADSVPGVPRAGKFRCCANSWIIHQGNFPIRNFAACFVPQVWRRPCLYVREKNTRQRDLVLYGCGPGRERHSPINLDETTRSNWCLINPLQRLFDLINFNSLVVSLNDMQ